jgi:hypothetical protein
VFFSSFICMFPLVSSQKPLNTFGQPFHVLIFLLNFPPFSYAFHSYIFMFLLRTLFRFFACLMLNLFCHLSSILLFKCSLCTPYFVFPFLCHVMFCFSRGHIFFPLFQCLFLSLCFYSFFTYSISDLGYILFTAFSLFYLPFPHSIAFSPPPHLQQKRGEN